MLKRVLLYCSLAAVTGLAGAQANPTSVGRGGQDDGSKSHHESAPKSDAVRAVQLMKMSMGRLPSVNVRAIVWQMGDGSGVMQQVKVEMDKSGKLHQIVLAPLRLQGYELVDDGKTTSIYSPDDKTLVVQPSARQQSDDTAWRMATAERNYSFKILRREKIAGRWAAIVSAIPKSDDLETRCYAIDEKTGFLLRLETCVEGRAPTVHLETKMVEFPVDFTDETFKLDPSFVNVRRVTQKCLPPDSGPKLAAELGFRPIVPNDLPYGFEVQQLQAINDASRPAVAVRITDGLAKATVLQWRGGDRNVPAPRGTRSMRAGRITLLVTGDIPEEVKERVLRAFANGASGMPTAWSQAPELRCPDEALAFDRECEGMAQFFLAIPAPYGI